MSRRCRRPVMRCILIAASPLVCGCAAYEPAYDGREQEYFLLHDGVYYPAEDGLPFDADVARYNYVDRYYLHRKPDPNSYFHPPEKHRR